MMTDPGTGHPVVLTRGNWRLDAPTVTLGSDWSGDALPRNRLFTGSLQLNGHTMPVWVRQDPQAAKTTACVMLWRQLGKVAEVGSAEHEATTSCAASLVVSPIRLIKRAPALPESLPLDDEIQLPPGDPLIGKWVLVGSDAVSGAARACARAPTEIALQPETAGAARFGYGSRVLWGISASATGAVCQGDLDGSNSTPLTVQSMTTRQEPRSFADNVYGLPKRIAALSERFLAVLIGAPVRPVRMTEAVVGDDSQRIVRLSPEVFRSIASEPGHTVHVSFGERVVLAIALEQTDQLSERLDSQLDETNQQAVTASPQAVIESRGRVPSHLRMWTSATVRRDLGVPRDCVVRVRRSAAATLGRHLNEFVLPAVSLVIAAVALDVGVPLATIGTLALLSLLLVARLRRKW